MPEQQSNRGNVITEANFEAPFATPVFPFGQGGVRLDCALDAIPVGEYRQLTNAYYMPGGEGALTARPGLTSAVTFGVSQHHSMVRVLDPLTGSATRLWGCGTAIARGTTGALTATDSGYSGAPLSLLTHRPPLSGAPYVFVGDTARNRKIRSDGLVLPIGLPAPTIASTAVLAAQVSVPVIPWTGATAVANWTANGGFTYGEPPVVIDPGSVIAIATLPNGDLAGGFLTNTASAQVDTLVPNDYYSTWGVPVTINLGTLGLSAATDEDFFHLWVRFSHADRIQEFRLYLVCSSVFSPSILPGLPNDADANMDAYVKAFSMNDFAQFIQTTQTQFDTAERARVHTVRDQSLEESSEWTGRTHNSQLSNTLQQRRASTDPVVTITPQAGAGSEMWLEFGVVGNPLRRGDFQRIGTTSGRDWSTITGIIAYVRVQKNSQDVLVSLGNMYLHGGFGPDSAEPGNIPYDYRTTNYDPRTGAEGNPSPEMTDANAIDSARRAIVVVPTAYGDTAVRQRIYRRGGTLTDDWYFVGTNASDGGGFADTLADSAIVTAGTVALDRYQPVATTSQAGATLLAQPVACFFGPYNGQLLATGNPYQPGFVYASLPDQPEAWPPDLAHEVCSPSEELLCGLMYGGQPYVFSRERLYAIYPNLTGANGMSSTPTQCIRGPITRWAFTVGAGAIWFRANDGLYHTQGGPEDRITDDLQPFFDKGGQSVQGYFPPSLTPADFQFERLAIFDQELWWSFKDTQGNQQTWIYQIATQRWRHYDFAVLVNAPLLDQGNPVETLYLGGLAGVSYTHTGTADGASAIAVVIQTGALNFGRPREEKLFGDQILDLDGAGVEINLVNTLNMETTVNAALTVSAGAGARVIFDGFGQVPQRARDISSYLTWSTDSTPPTLRRLGTSVTFQPDLTVNRPTNWDDGGHPDQLYVTGVTLDADTGGNPITVFIERDWENQVTTITELEVTHNGRHKIKYSWPAMPANMLRIRPENDCAPWILYRADWIKVNEPPRIAGWDIHFEQQWDQYLTGLDLYCDTEGLPKRIVVEVDGVVLQDPATALFYWEITTSGRQVVHLTLPWLRGHVLHFYATDENPGLLYDHRWHMEAEPSEQANWNQPFTILGTQADKYLKAVIFECDTFGEDKSVRVEADGALVTTITVNADGRRVVQKAIPMARGRVFRFFPADNFPSRLYTLRPVFDEEPFALTRWETQPLNHGFAEFQQLIEAQVTLKSTGVVTLTISTHVNQTGTIVTDTYEIPSTDGVKITRYVPFVARKGILFQYQFTAEADFWLYGAESHVLGEKWISGEPFQAQPWGDDDADPSRPMVNSTLAAARSGGVA